MIDTGDGADRAIGNKGGDLILGLGGADFIKGRQGKDDIGGGADPDRLSGQGNADQLAARDGVRDVVRGGASHHDRARVDRADRVRKVERGFDSASPREADRIASIGGSNGPRRRPSP